MFERDYIMRNIVELAHALARIAGKREAKEYSEALGDLEDTTASLTGQTLERIVSMPVAAILQLLFRDGDEEWARVGGLGRLVCERGRLCVEMGDLVAAEKFFKKAFILLDELEQGDADAVTAEDRETLSWLLDHFDSPSATK